MATIPAAALEGKLAGLEPSSKNVQTPAEPCPLDRTSCAGIVAVAWLSPLISQGYKKPLQEEDLAWELPKVLQWEALSARLQAGRCGKNDRRIERVLFSAFWRPWAFGGCLKFGYCCFYLVQPVLIGRLLQWLTDEDAADQRPNEGYVLACSLFAVSACVTLCINTGFHFAYLTGQKVRASIMGAIFRKTLRLKTTVVAEQQGNINSLMAVETERLWQALMLMHWLWMAPVLVLAILISLWTHVGVSALAGVLVMLAVAFCSIRLAKAIGRARRSMAQVTAERVKLVSEFLQAIRVIKMYNWEEPVSREIEKVRKQELHDLGWLLTLQLVSQWLSFITPIVVTSTIFVVYLALGNDLDVATVFTVMAYVGLLRLPVGIFAPASSFLSQALVSTSRLNDFFALDEIGALGDKSQPQESLQLQLQEQEQEQEHEGQRSAELAAVDIAITDADFAWADGSGDAAAAAESAAAGGAATVLKGLNLTVRRGELVMVVGKVGSGKSSLLAALLGEVDLINKGTVAVAADRGIAYASQQPWVRSASVRENINFGAHAEGAAKAEAVYEQVLEASQLLPDLKMLPAGDRTEIGERGITLSGGQKARVGFARACFHTLANDARVVLLDDPLSAVDAGVAQALFARGISNDGVLAGRTRVLTLNSHYEYLKHADRVVLLSKGEVVAQGRLEEIAEAVAEELPELDWAALRRPDARQQQQEEAAEEADAVVTDGQDGGEKEGIVIAGIAGDAGAGADAGADAGAGAGNLITEEDREFGEVSLSTYAKYFGAAFDLPNGRGGGMLFALVLVVFATAQAGRIVTDLYVARYAKPSPPSQPSDGTAIGLDHSDGDGSSSSSSSGGDSEEFIGAYVGLGVATCLLAFIRLKLFTSLALRCSRHLNQRTFWSVVRAPVNLFFDVTPMGRIINRFTKDLDSADLMLPDFFMQLLINGFWLAGMLAVCAASTPWFILLFVPLAALFVAVCNYFRRTSRELKRLEGVSRSPVFVIFDETLHGIATIRAHAMREAYLREAQRRVDVNVKAHLAFNFCGRWLQIRLDFVSVSVVFAAALFSVILKGTVDETVVGLALVYSLECCSLLSWTVRVFIETETAMTSVERLDYYSTSLMPEAPPIVEGNRPAAAWPSKGAIKLECVQMRYRPGLPLVLKELSLDIAPREKVGIVGRTGSGKSSIAAALFRVVEIESGTISIDGVDIKSIGLSDLRSKLSIIPQDPVLFSGTLRHNLDPLHLLSAGVGAEGTDGDGAGAGKGDEDAQVWRVLEQVYLREYVAEEFAHGLEEPIKADGDNLSVGQRQLVCLARALLRGSRVLLMDEATANVDSDTDTKIQRAISKAFEEQTLLCIAHRVDTILGYDRVAVLDAGRVVEIGPPAALAADAESAFARIIAKKQQRSLL